MNADDEIRSRTLEIASEYQMHLSKGNWDDWGRLWADDAVLEFPFAPPGRPSSYHGRSQIVSYMRAAAAAFDESTVTRRRIHVSMDPRVIIAELSISASLVGAISAYDQRYVVFIETGGGLIRHYREYWNPLVAVSAYGSMDAWLSRYPVLDAIDG